MEFDELLLFIAFAMGAPTLFIVVTSPFINMWIRSLGEEPTNGFGWQQLIIPSVVSVFSMILWAILYGIPAQ